MDATTRSMLTDAEQALLREADDRALRTLDEDDLIALHTRIRRARTKYVTMHRRRGAAQVASDRSRTRAAGSVSRTAVKAEAFEEALGRVSQRLGVVAAAAAEALKQERLAAAAGARPSRPKAAGTPAAKPARGRSAGGPKADLARQRTPIGEKRNASARASKQRAQARRDAGGRAR